MMVFLTAPHMPTTASVGVQRLIDPSEFGSNLVNTRTRSRPVPTPARSVFFPRYHVGSSDISPALREGNP